MSLTAALMSAQASIFDISRRVSTVSTNITRADDPNYARRVTENNVSGSAGTGVRRTVAPQLELMLRESATTASGAELTADKMAQLSRLLGYGDGALSSMMSGLQSRMELYAASPADAALGPAVVEQAQLITSTIRGNVQSLQGFAHGIGDEIQGEANNLESLLNSFARINKTVVTGRSTGQDVSDALDERSNILNQISGIVPVSPIERDSGDMMLVTTNGVTLFDKSPRDVTAVIDATNSSRNAVYIDGIAMRVPAGTDSASSNGRLAALLNMSQQVIPQAMNELDELARGLIVAFAETDQTGTGPDMAGLFTWAGGPDLSMATAHSPSMAATLSVNSVFIASQGGSPDRLRDGGANGANYLVNTAGYGSFSDRIETIISSLDAPFAFDPSVTGGARSLLDFASVIEANMETSRVSSSQSAERASALSSSLGERFSNTINVNLDEEIALLVDLQNSYEASSQILSVVDQMLARLFEVVR